MNATDSDNDDVAGPRAKSLKQPSHAPSSGGLATKGRFVPSNLKDTEVGWGVVHLYRDGQETPGLYDELVPAGAEFKEEDCTTLCILAVPSYMTPSDLLGFVGEQTREDVSHFRLIKTSRANKYMVLMKFREAKVAREWRREWNGKTFNSMEVYTPLFFTLKTVADNISPNTATSSSSNQSPSKTATSTTATRPATRRSPTIPSCQLRPNNPPLFFHQTYPQSNHQPPSPPP
jgi:BRCA1-associated protein